MILMFNPQIIVIILNYIKSKMKATRFLRTICVPYSLRSFSSNIDPSLPLYSNSLNHQEQPSSRNELAADMIDQRAHFEDSLKFAASQLSNKTDASTLVKLLRTSAFLENWQMCEKLIEYLKNKVS